LRGLDALVEERLQLVDRLLEVLPEAVADLREMAELDTQAVERAADGP